MSLLEHFFLDLERAWAASESIPLRLHVIGSSALMLQTNYRRGTKDADILELEELTPDIAAALIALAGSGTDLHARHHIYLDIVRSGLPFLPQVQNWHPFSFQTRLPALDVFVLDVVDVVVSKLKRFSVNDRSDIDAMVERGLVSQSALVDRFQAAVDWHQADALAEHIPQYVKNLNQVERDMLGVEETTIDLDGLRF